MQELDTHLQSNFGIETSRVREVAALFQPKALKKDEYFFRKGQYSKRLGYVQSGYLRVYDRHGDKEITQWIAFGGYFITDLMCFVFDSRSRWNIQAITDATLYVLEEESYPELEKIVPNWNEVEKRFIADCFVTLENRVFSHLSLNAEERYQWLFDFNKDLFLHVPLNYLASMLGMSPETFSRIRSRLSS
ncbi:MAG: Crp/Fnr family transcriptional regulator [Cyclobacteriaceae bacterium]